ncbi:nucleolar protein,Nop52 domain-containing protein [Hirsutella rhossiliensis]|uniref:Nucleolar protein,Nop52 domain-containing protein n=1 Tax=Hirsutella rhossiliensis TaxID=111463 RepID=A0A9P8SPQ3_9HYPO|nr:nucleolar protein,Nop52 domain-containing protein [Hirsutella rhossiliensis]KAH0968451.1 nucleolar protein,Nop52 domain-containing protein [Hirsutella rhossiliensis]
MAADAAAPGAEAAQMPFIKNLASSDRKLRTQSLDALQAFLASRAAGLPAADARRLWTGLFYALWMTDRPRPQQALAAALADLLFALPAAAAVGTWLRAFWAVLSAQWARIDALRLDKFLLLVRRVFAAHVRYARMRGYRFAAAGEDDVVAVLAEACFDADEAAADAPTGARVALGLRLHALDVWVDELERERALRPGPDAALDAARAAFVARLGAVVDALRAACPVKSVRRRAAESYADPRLPWAQAAADEEAMDVDGGDGGGDEHDGDDGWGGIED